MFDAETRLRLRTLQRRQDAGLATADERAELAKLVSAIENNEAAYLIPATERMREDRERLEGRNRKLDDLVRRREAFVERLRGFLEDARREREQLDSELAAVLAEDPSDSGGK